MIRLVRPRPLSDWKRFARVFEACFPYLDASERAWSIRNDGACTRLAIDSDNGAIAGFFTLLTNKGESCAWIEYVAVAPDYRGNGVSKQLMQEMERLGSEWGYPALELAVEPDNASAIALYKRSGYEQVERPGRKLTFRKALPPGGSPAARPGSPGKVERLIGRLLYPLLAG